MTKPISQQTPIEIDTQLAEIYGRQQGNAGKQRGARDTIRHYSGQRSYGYGHQKTWSGSFPEALEAARAKGAETGYDYNIKGAREAVQRYEALLAEEAALEAEAAPLNAEFQRRGGWTRAFLVTNGDGHVHKSMTCSTCNRGQYATSFYWVIEYSGHDEAEIVEAAGWRACTICYPSAPVGDENSLPTKMFSDQDRDKAKAKAEREEAKAARQAKKIANGLTPDGEPLEVETVFLGRKRIERFATERAASTWAVGRLTDKREYGYNIDEDEAAVNYVIERIAAKHGQTVAEAQAEIDRKVAAKIKRDKRY